jgi:hypothetical protein
MSGDSAWAARHAPQQLGLADNQLAALNDDVAALALDIATHATQRR